MKNQITEIDPKEKWAIIRHKDMLGLTNKGWSPLARNHDGHYVLRDRYDHNKWFIGFPSNDEAEAHALRLGLGLFDFTLLSNKITFGDSVYYTF